MTAINIDLSATLQQTLSNAGNGTYVYAFAFGATTSGGAVGLVDSAMVVSNGALTSTTSLDVTAGQFYSGGVYVVIQQGGNGNLLNEISSASDIIQNATAKNYSYQLFEATLSGSQYDLGDISAVNTFGFTSTYEVVYQNGSDTRGFNTTADSIFSAIPPAAVSQYANNQFPNADQLATGPATANNQAPWPSSGWKTYVDAVKNSAATLADIEIVYSFQGTSKLPAELSQYGVEYVASDQYGDDYFWLVPDNSNGAKNIDWIRIPVSQLMQNIFVQPGPLEVHIGGKGGKVVYYDSFTPNNPEGGVAKHFVAGFDAGFWGGQGVSANAQDDQTFDFNKGYNWNINYAYDAILLAGVGSADFENTLVTNPGVNDFIYDPWAQQFIANSNAYGYSYSDLVSAGGVNPQIALWDPEANSGAGANVETINITIYDTDEIPASGYRASSTGYVAPAISGYEAANTPGTLQLGFDFNFSVGTTMYAPADDTPIVLKIYAPHEPGADGDGFVSLTVTGGAGNSDWYYYIINPDATNTWAFQLSNPTGEKGFFNIQNLPTTHDGSVAWYQLVFGEGDDQSIYNIYYDPNSPTSPLVVDHGIGITSNPNGSYTLSFAPGGHMFYDIDTFAPPVGSSSSLGSTIYGTNRTNFVNALETVGAQAGPTNGDDTIYGRGGRDYLSGLGGNDTIDGGAGIDMLRGNDGDDTLQVRGREGIHDYFHGGADTDTLQFIGNGAVTLNGFKAIAASIEILQGNGRGLFGTGQMDVFDLGGLIAVNDLPFIDAGGGDDLLTGSDFADDLRGGAGRDILEGGDGDDTLNGGTGVDMLSGGDGDDILQVRGREGVYDTFDGGAGTDTLQLIGTVTLAGFDAGASSIEILQGSGRGLNGTGQADIFDLSGLTAMTGLRFIDAKGGDDILIGSDFDDTLRGGAGDDVLDGRGGNDTLNGGSGRNTFVFGDGYGADTVIGYKAGRDTFDLTGVSGATDFSDLTLTEIAPRIVLIDFGGDTLTIRGTTIALLTANQGDFLF
jgi:hypothetical protein